MTTVRALSLALSLAFVLPSTACRLSGEAASGVAGPMLDGAPLAHWVALLEPAPEDTAWLAIPWHASFHAGLEAADRADRPLLLWLMNGHPLGCT